MEWCPWLVLSPLVMWLAECCRFDRARWMWGVLPHLPACVLVALAYQGISMLLMEGRINVAFTNNAGVGGVVKGGLGAVQVFGSGTNFSPTAFSPDGFAEAANLAATNSPARVIGFGFGSGSVSVQNPHLPLDPVSSGPHAADATQVSPLLGHFVEAIAPPIFPPMPGRWTRFLHIAATRAQYTIPIYWAIVCVTWIISYYQQLRERERHTLELEARLTQANLQTLKTQLQPHFLFNTLNAIASLVRRKPNVAEDMIGTLSEFLRMNLDAGQEHEVPLRREMEFLDLYLEIQQTRFGERLRIQKEIDPAALDVAVPTLILQPLVENFIRHGIEPRENGGTIWIRALRHEQSLRLEVRDDGQGFFGGGQLVALREGIGLSNTKARLQELYGDAHHFQIAPNADGGLTVSVEIPGARRWMEGDQTRATDARDCRSRPQNWALRSISIQAATRRHLQC